MPEYFIDTDDGKIFVRDEDGITLEGPAQAKALAVATLGEMLRDARADRSLEDFRVSIRDATRTVGEVKVGWSEGAGWVADSALTSAIKVMSRLRG